MQYKTLGGSGIQVSELCFGTMSFGGNADAAAAAKMYAATRDAGINFYDCANVYNRGEAERILGKLIHPERAQLVITSKCALPTSDQVNARGGSRRHLVQSIEASLTRLNTDYLDILLMHHWDAATPLEETLRGLEDAVRAGKVLYLGASNYAAWQVAKGLGIAARRGWSRFEVVQPMYNLVKRQVESEILPLAAAEGLGVMTYGPVGGGLLSGKYTQQTRPAQGRLVENADYRARYDEAWVYETAARFANLARQHNLHPVSLAVAWVKSHPQVTCPIIGARNLEQLGASLDALKIDMSAAFRQQISALSRTPPLATDRLEEQVAGECG